MVNPSEDPEKGVGGWSVKWSSWIENRGAINKEEILYSINIQNQERKRKKRDTSQTGKAQNTQRGCRWMWKSKKVKALRRMN